MHSSESTATPKELPFSRKTVGLPWGDVSYLEWSPRFGQSVKGTLVLLHGGGLDSASLAWSRLGPEMADVGYRVIAPDHPGFGCSAQAPWVADQSHLRQYVGIFLEKLGINEYFIGGISLGGGLAIGHSLSHQEQIKGVVLIGSYGLMDRPFTSKMAVPLQLLSWISQRSGIFRLVRWGMVRSERLLRKFLFSLLVNQESHTDAVVRQVQKELLRNSGAFGQWQRSEMGPTRLRTNYADSLGDIKCPVFLLHGDRDQLVPLAYARKASHLLPDAQLVIVPKAGHWVQRDRPELVSKSIVSFLDNCSCAYWTT